LLQPNSWQKTALAGNVPLREVSVPVVPVSVRSMEWQNGTGEVWGGDSYLEFALPVPQRVAAIQLKYFYKHDNSPATLRAHWRRSDQQDFGGSGRSTAVKLPTNPGERTATIWMPNEIMDAFRIYPHHKACTFKIAEIVLLVPESGQPQRDTGGGEGTLDVAGEEQIAGWAWDKKQPDSAILVDIYDGEKKLATVVADQFRQDLLDAGIGNGRHAFSYRTPASLKDGKAHTIRVKTAGANTELSDSAKSISFKADSYQQLIQKIQEVVHRTLPAEATVLVVSKGDEELLKLSGRRGWHFPQTEEGEYAGNPADSAEAIAYVEKLKAKGAQFLLFPQTAWWWLDHYKEFKQHLDSRYRRIHSDDQCIIFELTRSKG
jgi:hypothetical protein